MLESTQFIEVPTLIKEADHSEEGVRQMVIDIAKENGVSVDLALYVAKNESGFSHKAVGDLHITCSSGPRKGTLVYARGVFQFTRCYYPHITDEQAFDPEFNIRLAMPLLKNKTTCRQQFTTCRNYYGL